ncbi:MAG: GGDEF domain-containing protein [Spirochaetales bacterium]|nr:GGDEF domain-containing protein [Spirochaetales bacterium]
MKKTSGAEIRLLSVTILFPLLTFFLLASLILFEIVGIRKFMSCAASTLPLLLEEDFHDRVSTPGSISGEEQERNCQLMKGIREKFVLDRVYTVMEREGLHFLVAPLPEPYANIPGEFLLALKEMNPFFFCHRDERGRICTFLLPLESPGGQVYLSCVDLTVEQLIRRGLSTRGVELFLILMVAFFGEAYFLFLKKRNAELYLVRHEASTHRKELERVSYERSQESKVRSDRYDRLNHRLLAALEASNLTLVMLDMESMTIVQETNFTYEGEEPERIEDPVSFEGFFLEYIHPNGHHVIKDALHEFMHEGIDEKTIELRIYHDGRWLWFRFFCRRNEAAPNELVILGQMIHQEKIRSEELYRKANYDALTRMVNRHYCYSYLENVLFEKRKGDFPMAVAFVDADSLKKVNDVLGHKLGDRYLLDIVEIINRGIRDEDILGRIGGDEFLLLCPKTSAEDFSFIEDRIVGELETFNSKRDRPYCVSFSMGYLEVDGSEELTVDYLLEEADSRMYKVKQAKKLREGGIRVLYEGDGNDL